MTSVTLRNGSGSLLDPKDRLLHIEDVYKAYGPRTVLDNVDLRVGRGELVALVGPSGCGKSTLLRLISGEESPSSGHLYLDGQPLGHPDQTRGMVYQKYTLFPHLTILENVLLGRKLSMSFLEWRMERHREAEQAMEHLRVANLLEEMHKYPHQISGGQQQRAAVIQALIMDPKVLLMDEPFGALDPGTRERMQVFLLERWEKTRKTIFFVTHDLEEAVYLATRVVVLSQYWVDNRKLDARGARVVYDIPVGTPGQASSTKSKLDPRFTAVIEEIRDRGFNPNHSRHVEEFDLRHEDSFHTVSLGDVSETSS